MNDASASTRDGNEPEGPPRAVYICDRCGFEMIARQCKVICPNCGSRWDCSDLSIYVDEPGRGLEDS